MIYRLNYDKPHRCPRWSGSGWRTYPWEKIDDKCDGMSFPDGMYEGRWWRWRFNRCSECGTLCWPHIVREIDLYHWGERLLFWVRMHKRY